MSAIIQPADIIRKYYSKQPFAWDVLLDHSRKVTKRALKIGRFLATQETIDLQFIAEAAMLHDIGVIQTATPDIGCHGKLPYLCHGIAGRKILEKEGYPRHALVCERHIGIGLTAKEIKQQQLPLPARDMLPLSLEEQVICYADLFYSKSPKKRDSEKSPKQVHKSLSQYGTEKLAVFNQWQKYFEPELS